MRLGTSFFFSFFCYLLLSKCVQVFSVKLHRIDLGVALEFVFSGTESADELLGCSVQHLSSKDNHSGIDLNRDTRRCRCTDATTWRYKWLTKFGLTLKSTRDVYIFLVEVWCYIVPKLANSPLSPFVHAWILNCSPQSLHVRCSSVWEEVIHNSVSQYQCWYCNSTLFSI